jgi:hypothetical protein
MKNVTLLRQNIRVVLAHLCGDAHDVAALDGTCDACEDLEDALIEAVENWRVRAYKTTKGKI